MTAELKALDRKALELATKGDFGSESVRVNSAIVELAPEHEAAWTRLGRSHLEQRHFDDAVVALRQALALNPSNRIATNLLTEVRRQRALAPPSVVRAQSGFGPREFTLLETLSSVEACRVLKPRVEALLDTVNATSIARRIVETRQKNGAHGSTLFQSNSIFPGATGHIYGFHYGGRWEPQFNIGWFASTPLPSACFRAGLGFNLSAAGRDPDREEGQERILQFFERFQQVVANAWREDLIRWMTATGGFIQLGEQPPLVDVLPEQAVERVLAVHDAASLGWVFCGRWLFLERPDDAAVLGDRSKLAKAVEDTFQALYPIWLSVYQP